MPKVHILNERDGKDYEYQLVGVFFLNKKRVTRNRYSIFDHYRSFVIIVSTIVVTNYVYYY